MATARISSPDTTAPTRQPASTTIKAMIGVNAGLGLDTSLDAVGYLLGLATFGLALLAAVLPAVRGATRVDPVVALRAE